MKYSQICKTRKFVSVFAQFLQLQAYVQTKWAKSSIDICFIFVWKTFAIFIIQHLNNKHANPSTLFCFCYWLAAEVYSATDAHADVWPISDI